MLFKWFPSDTQSEFGLRVSEQTFLLYNCKYVRRVSILLPRDFFTTQPFSKLDLFQAIFLHIVTMILESCPFTLVLLYQQYNCSVVSRRLHDMTSVVLA
jgi:hypothetical protein